MSASIPDEAVAAGEQAAFWLSVGYAGEFDAAQLIEAAMTAAAPIMMAEVEADRDEWKAACLHRDKGLAELVEAAEGLKACFLRRGRDGALKDSEQTALARYERASSE